MNTDLLESHSPGLRHEALFYTHPGELERSLVEFVGGGIEAGQPTLVVLAAHWISTLSHRLPSSDYVEYEDMTELGRNPARLISRWNDFVGAHGSEDRPLRGVGEPVWPGRSAEQVEECQIHEELLNLAFDPSHPWTLLCPYDIDSLDPAVVERARLTHPHPGGETQLPPPTVDESLRLLEGPLPSPPPVSVTYRFAVEDLRDLRRFVMREATLAGIGDKREDFVLGVDEVATHSLVHGDGCGEIRMWKTERSVVCEVLDDDRIRDPLVGRRRPPAGRPAGHGLWLANQLCDLVQVRSRPTGTVVRLHMFTT